MAVRRAPKKKIGRPPSATEKVAVQIRLEVDEAKALDVLVERRRRAAADVGATVSAAAVLRAIVRKALMDEGLLSAPSAEPLRSKGGEG